MDREVDLRADIVVAGLPYQGEPLCDALLARIQPQAVVVVDSEFPAPERASPQLRERLTHGGIPVLCTRETGAVQIALHRSHWRLATMRGDRLTATARPGKD